MRTSARSALRPSVLFILFILFVLFSLGVVLPEVPEAACELRMSPSDRGSAGPGWSVPARARSGLRITSRNLRPYQLRGLRFDGLELGWGPFVVSGGQLGADGYREQSVAAGFGSPGIGARGWFRGELFLSGPIGSAPGLGGVRSHRGASLSGGYGFELGDLRGDLAALDLLRSGDVDLPPVTWRAGVVWSRGPEVELRACREWGAVGDAWDRASLIWEVAPRVRIEVGLDDREPILGFELGGAGLDVRAWTRSQPGLAPTTALEVRFHLPSVPALAPESASAPAIPPGHEGSGSTVSVTAPRPVDGSMADPGIDAPPPWELEPEEAAQRERPWVVPDSLTVWELRADTRAEATEAGGEDRAGGIERRRSVSIVPGSDLVLLPIRAQEIAAMEHWPSVSDSVWGERRASWKQRQGTRPIRALSDLSDLPEPELEFWRPWIPYLSARGEIVPPGRRRGLTNSSRGSARIETRTRTRNGRVERQAQWSSHVPVANSEWTFSGLRESDHGPMRASLRGQGTSWKWRADWGTVRPGIGLDVDLGRSVVGNGGFVAAEHRRGTATIGGRLGADGGDLDLGYGSFVLAASSGGLWQIGLHEGGAGLDVLRTPRSVWFLRTKQELSLSGVALRLQTTERLHGAAATSRSDARSLRFDRRASWARTVPAGRTHIDLRWRKGVADGVPIVTVPPFQPAATETREVAAGFSGRSGPAPWSVDLRLRRTASRAAGRLPARTTSLYLRHRGVCSDVLGPATGLRLGWELGLRGTYRVGGERTQSWIAVYREQRISFGLCTWGLCEVRGVPGSRATLDVSWSPLRPRSVAANSRWGIGTLEGRVGTVHFVGSGAIPLANPGEEASWELRLRLELPLPLSPGPDPG